MSNPNKEVLDYEGQLTAERYNQFFNPNICHVCKTVDKGNFVLCHQCCLISYCNEEHKTIHYMEHEKICKIIKVLRKSQEGTCRYSSWQQWIQSRKEFMELIQQRYGRPLEPYMQQMILWSKSCSVCHQQNKLRVCQTCFSANYCDEHAEVFNKKHNGDKCERLLRLLNIDIQIISGKTTNISYEFLPLINAGSHFEEMLELCMKYMLSREKLDWLAKDYLQTNYLSGPLTIYSGLKTLNLLHILQENHIVIHIIAANNVERNSLLAWEILLHLLPQLQNLTIIMIGPELMHNFDEPKLCFCCVYKKKKLAFFPFAMLYHDYLESYATFKIPNIVIGFDVELNKEETLLESIKAIRNSYNPLFLTCSSQAKVRNNIIKIQEALCANIEPVYSKRNYFSGLAPYRDLDTGDTYFRNEYLIIYDDLLTFDTEESSSNSDE